MERNSLTVLLILIMLLSFSGCAHMANDGSRTRTEGAGTGAAAGAVVGAIVGQLVGSDTASTLIGAGIGTVVGLAAGYAYGDHVATQKKQYASEEDWLDACLADAQQRNQEILSYNEELSRQIMVFEQDLQLLREQHSQTQEEAAALARKKGDVDNLLMAANKELKAARIELDLQNMVASEAKNSGKGDFAVTLDSEILTLQASIKELEKNTAELASLSASMSV